ncbi:MAG: antitoxin MazE family protein [Candidatus Accumulibacter sp.]|jgi:hypothetical protein|nr:antitoxin MazE family protein [Accumulibacter sp.]
MTTTVNARVQKHRAALRDAGLRLVQLWVPDTRRPDFPAECRRQSRIVAQADFSDIETQTLLEEALHDVEGWTE